MTAEIYVLQPILLHLHTVAPGVCSFITFPDSATHDRKGVTRVMSVCACDPYESHKLEEVSDAF